MSKKKNGRRCPGCGLKSTYARKDGSFRCYKCGKEVKVVNGVKCIICQEPQNPCPHCEEEQR